MITNAKRIKEDVDILKVISEYVKLEKKGSSYKGCCPFHDEKTPSFSVSPSKNIFKCFGCGESGNAIHFVMQHENVSYPKALEIVADICNIIVEYEDSEKAKQFHLELQQRKVQIDALKPLVKLSATWFHNRGLADFKRVKNLYEIAGRNYTEEIVKRFRLGWSPPGSHLKKHAKANNWDMDQLHELGIIGTGKNGDYDFFYNRFIFPIFNHRGDEVGFGGRIPGKSSKHAKYINSPDSVVYQKSELLYGLSQNKKAIGKAGFAYLVEGYTDVLTMTQFGVENAVASCGTALSEEQCRLLKRYCSKVVVLRDGDDAGQSATIRDIELFVKADFEVKVLFIPEDLKTKKKHDPDSFLRTHGKDAFLALSEVSTQDGILWSCTYKYDKKDAFSVESCIQHSARLLNLINSEIRKDHYIRELNKPAYFNNKKRLLQEAIQKEFRKDIKRRKNRESDLDPIQEQDVINYGVYVRSNGKGAVFYKLEKKIHIPLTNFVIIPIYHINSIENPSKIVTIRNEHGLSRNIDIPTSLFGDFKQFRLKMLEYGNYRFLPSCRTEDYMSIMGKIIEECMSCYKISTLGYHNKGFYTWNNGITMPDGSFQECTQNGLVEYEDIRYILPGKTISNKNDDSYDDDDTEGEYISLFTYKPSQISLRDWANTMLGVYEDNGLMAIAYYICSLYRDIIYKRFKFFPHLNLFGPPQKGKSTIAWSLSYMFGEARRFLNLSNFTSPGFSGRGQQVRNGIMWCDEFKNELDLWVHELLKGAYDGSGREKRTLKSNKSTQNQAIYNALVISGQDLPNRDIALLTRCITLMFNYKKTQAKEDNLASLQKLEKTGQLSGITSDLQKYRSEVQQQFNQEFDKAKGEVHKKLMESSIVSSRILQNHVIPLTVVRLIEQFEEFPTYKGKKFSDALIDFIITLIHRQSVSVIRQDEVAGFWRTFRFLHAQKMLKHDQDFIIENKRQIRVLIKDTRSNTELKQFEGGKKILFLRFTRSIPLYKERTRKEGEVPFKDEQLKHYLSTSDAFLGKIRGKKFDNGKTTVSCYAFDLELLEFDLPLSKEVIELNDSYVDMEQPCDFCDRPLKECICLEPDKEDK